MNNGLERDIAEAARRASHRGAVPGRDEEARAPRPARGAARRGLRPGGLAAGPAHRGHHAEGAGHARLSRPPARRRAGDGRRARSRRGSSRRRRGSTRCGASSTSTSRASARSSSTPIDWSLTHGFFRDVLKATARIRYGQVSTYAEVAAKAGNPKAVRAAGNGLGSNPMPVVVPCHRVVRTRRRAGRLHRRARAQGVPARPRAPLSRLAELGDRHGLRAAGRFPSGVSSRGSIGRSTTCEPSSATR